MKFHTLKGHKVRLGIASILDFRREGAIEPAPWLMAQNRIAGRLMPAHSLFPCPSWSEEEVVAQLETFALEGGCFVGELGGLMIGFSISDRDGDLMILSNLGS
jgi:hypothetical protein